MRRLLPLILLGSLALGGCGGSTEPLDPAKCAAVPDEIHAAFGGLATIEVLDVDVDPAFCAGQGSYRVKLASEQALTAAELSEVLTVSKTVWETHRVGEAPEPSLEIDSGETGLIKLDHGIVEPDLAEAITSIVRDEWRGVVNVDLSHGTFADVPWESRRVAIWVPAESDLSALDSAWEAMSTSLDTLGINQGEVGVKVPPTGTSSLPVAAGSATPGQLTEFYRDWIALTAREDVQDTQLNAAVSGVGTFAALTPAYPDHIELTPDTADELDRLVGMIEEMGCGPVEVSTGLPVM